MRWSHLLCNNWFACKQLISAKIALGLKLISLRLKRISADKYKAWILMMRHAWELQKNLHNHPFTWNKQYIFKPARSSRKHVSSYLSFSVHLVLYCFWATHARPSAVQEVSGQCGRENAICSRTITSTWAAVHARSCLFISARCRMLMLIDFIKAYPAAETWALQSLHINRISPAECMGLTAWQMWMFSCVEEYHCK